MEAIWTRYRKEKQAAGERLLAQSEVFETALGVVEAAQTGQGNAILISHGSGGGYDMGLWLADLIGGQGRYIAPSRFGYLRSPVPRDHTPEMQADIYAALLDRLRVDSAVCIGLSAGGASALQFALRHPGRCLGLIMISAVSQSVPPLPRFLRAVYPLMLKSDFLPWLLYTIAPGEVFHGNGISRKLLRSLKNDREKMIRLDALYRTTFPSTPRSAGMLCDLELMTLPFRYPIEKITAPALVIHAVNDPIIPIQSGENTAGKIHGARFLKLEDGGHFTCVTHSEEVLPAIWEFLGRVEAWQGRRDNAV